MDMTSKVLGPFLSARRPPSLRRRRTFASAVYTEYQGPGAKKSRCWPGERVQA